MAHAYLELQLTEEGLHIYRMFLDTGFTKSNYIVSQIAVAYHNMRGKEGFAGPYMFFFVIIYDCEKGKPNSCYP